jgi:hypothetical protein
MVTGIIARHGTQVTASSRVNDQRTLCYHFATQPQGMAGYGKGSVAFETEETPYYLFGPAEDG